MFFSFFLEIYLVLFVIVWIYALCEKIYYKSEREKRKEKLYKDQECYAVLKEPIKNYENYYGDDELGLKLAQKTDEELFNERISQSIPLITFISIILAHQTYNNIK